MRTVCRVYDSYAQARATVEALEKAGFASADISLVANKHVSKEYADVKDVSDTATGAGIGAGLGGAAGLLAGLGLLAIPGLGPVVAAGWLASTALGAVAGGATGGVVGALTQAGVSEEEAPLYAEGVRRGGTMVSARVPDGDRARYEAILDQSAVNLRDRSAAWQRSGWKSYDPAAQPYGADEVRRERRLYDAG